MQIPKNQLFYNLPGSESNKYGIYPEHPRALDYDKEHPGGIKNMYPGGGGYAAQAYNVAYTKAMMQAVVSLKDVGVSA